MKRKNVTVSLLAMMLMLAGCESNSSESAKPSTETPATETPSTETPATETPATEAPSTDTATEKPSESVAPEPDPEPEELLDSTEEEILAVLRNFANSKSYSVSFEIGGNKYKDIVTDRYIYHDQTKSGVVLYDSFDPSSTNNYDQIVYNFSMDEEGHCVMGMPYLYNGGYYQAYLNNFYMFTTLHSLKDRYASALATGALTDSDSIVPGKWVVSRTSAGYALFNCFSGAMSGYSEVINFEFHLYTDGTLHVELLHYKVDENGAAVTDEDGKRIIESIATFVFGDIDEASSLAVEARFPDKGGIDHYVPTEFNMLMKKPLTIDATLSLVDKTGVEKTTVYGKSEINLNNDAEEYIYMDADGNVTNRNQYFNVDGVATKKSLDANNEINAVKLTSSGKDLKWADTATDFSFLAVSTALTNDDLDSTALTYLNPINASNLIDMMSNFSLAYGFYGDVTSLKFYKNSAGVIDSAKAILSDGGSGSLKTQFHYEIDIKFTEGKEIVAQEPLAGEEGTVDKITAALGKLDGTHNVSMKAYSGKSDVNLNLSSERILSNEGADALDAYLYLTYSGSTINALTGYKKDGENGYIPFKKLRSSTAVRATGASLTDYSFKDALGFGLNAKVFTKKADGTYTIDGAVDYDNLTNYSPLESVYGAGDTLTFKLNDAEDAIEEIDYAYTSSYWGTTYYKYTFTYGDDVTIDDDYVDAVNALTAFRQPSNWKEYLTWALDLTMSSTSSYYTDFIKYFRFDGSHMYNGTDDDARRTVEEAENMITKVPFVWYDRLGTDYCSMSYNNYSSFNDTQDGVEGTGKWCTFYINPCGTSDQKKALYPEYTKKLVADGFKLLSSSEEKRTYRCHAINANTKYSQYYNEDLNLLIEVANDLSDYIYVTEMVDAMYTFTPNFK